MYSIPKLRNLFRKKSLLQIATSFYDYRGDRISLTFYRNIFSHISFFITLLFFFLLNTINMSKYIYVLCNIYFLYIKNLLLLTSYSQRFASLQHLRNKCRTNLLVCKLIKLICKSKGGSFLFYLVQGDRFISIWCQMYRLAHTRTHTYIHTYIPTHKVYSEIILLSIPWPSYLFVLIVIIING